MRLVVNFLEMKISAPKSPKPALQALVLSNFYTHALLLAALFCFHAHAEEYNPLAPSYGDDKPRKFVPVEKSAPKKTGHPHMISEVMNLSCLPSVEESDAAAILARYKIKLVGANEKETLATARSVSELARRLGLRKSGASWLDRTSVVFVDVLPIRSDGGCLPGIQTAPDGVPTITFARRCPKKSMQGAQKLPVNEGTIVHEYGHVVANRGGLYPLYENAVEERCAVSGYSVRSSAGRKHKSRNEEFAEAFAAFLIAPTKLKAACPDTFAFFKQRLYRGTSSSCKKIQLPK